MTANGLRPYPAYRDSGLDWLGDVPEHWQVRRLGAFGRFFKGNGGTKADETEDGVPCIRYGDLYTKHRFHITASKACVPSDRAGAYTSVRYSDVLFAGSGETLEEIGKSAVNLIKGSAVCGGDVIVFRPTLDLDAEFIGWSTDYRHAASQKARMGRGITVMHIYASELKCLAVPLPPLPEQHTIARYLDAADRRIRRYIRAKERLIELLEERKRAVVHEAVTGQIDVRTGQPYTDYKDSGVEWLGKVPEHWERRRLKTLLRVVDRRSSTGEETLLSLRRDHGVVVYSEHFARPPQGRTLVGYKQLAVGQLVVNRLQANNGLVFCSGVDGLVSPDYSVFEKTAPVQMKYLSDLLRTSVYRSHFRRVSTGLGTGTAGFLRLYDDVFLSTTVFLPSEDEQVSILEYLAVQRRKIEGLVASAENGLALLDEYRTRLIADVVTGKLDVREATARLRSGESDNPQAERESGDVASRHSRLEAETCHR